MTPPQLSNLGTQLMLSLTHEELTELSNRLIVYIISTAGMYEKKQVSQEAEAGGVQPPASV